MRIYRLEVLLVLLVSASSECPVTKVKCGPDVTKEAENQQIPYELVDSRIVRIPRVYAFLLTREAVAIL